MRAARRHVAATATALCCGFLGTARAAGQLEYQTDRLRWLGSMRYCESFAGASVTGSAPLLLVLGRPGRSARYGLDSWRQIADQEGVIVAAVGPAHADSWQITHDGPAFLRAVVEQLARRYPIDRRRVYLFGYDAGGGFVLSMGLLQSRYFAAVASFGGDLPPGSRRFLEQVERPIPVALFRGKRDQQVALSELQSTRELLVEAGVPAELVEVKGLGSDFERRGHKAAALIWAALSAHALVEDPRFKRYPFDS